MPLTAFKPPPHSAAPTRRSDAQRSAPLGGLPRREGAATPKAIYVPKSAEGEDAGPDPREVIAAERAALDAQVEQLTQRQQALEELKTRYIEGLSAVAEAAERAERVLTRDAVAIAMVLTHELMGHALATDPKAISDIVRDALRQVPEDAKTRVKVAPDDLPRVEIVLAGSKRSAIDLVADPQLQPGDCIVESPNLVVDARLRERLAAVGETLQQSVAADARQSTHDEVSLDEPAATTDQGPPPFGGGPDPQSEDGPPGLADAPSASDFGPDSISLDDPA